MSELEEVLEDYRQEGELDSSGFFTLDTRTALEKMRRFQLGTPYDYVLNLVAAAVASGAEAIRVTTRPRAVAVEWASEPLTGRAMAEVFSSLLTARSGNRAHQELAVGLYGALGRKTREVVIESWDGQAGARMVLGSRDGKVEPLSMDPHFVLAKGNRVEVRRRRGILERLKIWLIDEPPHPEVGLLHRRCGDCPVSLLIDDKPVNQAFREGQALILSRLEGPALLPRCDLPSLLQRETPSPGPFSAYLALIDDKESRRLRLVVNGITFYRNVNLGTPRAWALVCAPELSKNLSQAEVVENEDYQEILKVLRAELETMEEDFVLRYEGGITRGVRALFYAAARRNAAHARLSKAREIYARLAGELSGAGRSLAAVAYRLGDVEEALRLVQEQLSESGDDLKTAELEEDRATLWLENGRFDKALGAAERAEKLRESFFGQRKLHRQALSRDLLASLELARGRVPAAQVHVEEALRKKEHLGSHHHQLAPTLELKALVRLRLLGKDGLEPADQALKCREDHYGPEHIMIAPALTVRSLALQAEGKTKEALGACWRRNRLFEKAYGPQHPEVAACLNLQGLLHRLSGRREEAEKCLTEALAMLQGLFGPDHPDLWRRPICYRGWFHERSPMRCSLALYLGEGSWPAGIGIY